MQMSSVNLFNLAYLPYFPAFECYREGESLWPALGVYFSQLWPLGVYLSHIDSKIHGSKRHSGPFSVK